MKLIHLKNSAIFFLSFLLTEICIFQLHASESFVVMNDSFTQFKHDSSIYSSALPRLKELGLNCEELLKMEIPRNWFIQWSTFPKNCTYEKNKNGFLIHSPDEPLWIVGRATKIGNCKYLATLDVTNLSDEQIAEISLECIDFSMLCKDKTVVKNVSLEKNTRKTLTYEFSCKGGFINVAPSLEIKGNVLLHSFHIDAIPESGVTCIEGTVLERSALPDPAKSNYPNCRYTIHFEGNAILAGEPCQKELALTVEGFQNKKMLKTDMIQSGSRIICTVVPFDMLSEKEQETQVADDLHLFQLENYYVLAVDKIDDFSSAPMIFADANQIYTSIFERHINPDIPESLILEQENQVRQIKEKMNLLTKDYTSLGDKRNRKFDDDLKIANQNIPAGKNHVVFEGYDCIWKQMNQSFWCFPVGQPLIRKYNPMTQEKKDALLALQKCLNANGVQLIVSIVPHVFDISSRVMFPEFRNVPDYSTAWLVKELADIGIEALYASDAILADYNRYPFAYLIPYDGHPGDTVQDILAEKMAKRLACFGFTRNLERDKFTFQDGEHVYVSNRKCMFPANCDIGENQAGTAYPCQCIFYDGKELQCDRKSEIIVIGNSYMRTPRGTPESYPAHLAKYLLVNPDCYMVQSHGPMVTLIARLFNQPEKYLKGKKVMILQMGEEHFHADITWNNIEQMDRYQLAMTGKKLVKTVIPAGENVTTANPMVLPEKHEFMCKKEQKTVISTIDCGDLDASKPIVCLIPACASPEGKILLHCNENSQMVPPYLSYAPAWNQLLFELPAGTQKIVISVSGSENEIAAIQKIQLLQ